METDLNYLILKAWEKISKSLDEMTKWKPLKKLKGVSNEND